MEARENQVSNTTIPDKSTDEISKEPHVLPFPRQRTISTHDHGCNSITFLHKSQRLITGGKDNVVMIWDTNTGALSKSLTSFNGSVSDLAVTPDDTLLVAALSSHRLCIWDLGLSQICTTLTGHTQMVTNVDVSKSPGKNIAVSTGNDKLLIVWDLENFSRHVSTHLSRKCSAIHLGLNGVVSTGHHNGKIQFFDVNGLRVLSEIASNTQPVISIRSFKGENVILASGRDDWHKLIDLRSMEVCGKFRVRCGGSSCVGVSRDGRYVAVGSSHGSVHIWSVEIGRLMYSLRGHVGSVTSCSWSSAGMPFASAGTDGNVVVWY